MINFTDQSHNSTNGSSQGHDIIPIPFWIFFSIETVITIAGNAVLCWLFVSNKKLRTNQNYFIVSLSVSDLLVGLSIVPCEYCRVGRDKSTEKQCQLICGSVISFNMIASIINLVLISSDRYFSIKKPYRYIQLFTKRRAILIIAIGWILTIVFISLPIPFAFEEIIDLETGMTVNMVYSAFLFSLTIFAGGYLAWSYYAIVMTIRKKVRETREAPSNPAGIKVCIISSIIFFISWIPYTVVEILMQTLPNKMQTLPEITDAAYFILILSPCLDPLLYAYYRRDFRSCLVAYYRKNSLSEMGRRVVHHITFRKRTPSLKRKHVRNNPAEQNKFIQKVESHLVNETNKDTVFL